MGLAFGAHLQHNFSIKMVFIWNSNVILNVISFFFLKIWNKMCYWVLIQTIDNIMNFKIYLRSSSKAMANRQKKMGRTEIQKIEYLEKKESFVDEIKSSFHSFWRAIIWWKNKNLMKIVDTRFKLTLEQPNSW